MACHPVGCLSQAGPVAEEPAGIGLLSGENSGHASLDREPRDFRALRSRGGMLKHNECFGSLESHCGKGTVKVRFGPIDMDDLPVKPGFVDCSGVGVG